MDVSLSARSRANRRRGGAAVPEQGSLRVPHGSHRARDSRILLEARRRTPAGVRVRGSGVPKATLEGERVVAITSSASTTASGSVERNLLSNATTRAKTGGLGTSRSGWDSALERVALIDGKGRSGRGRAPASSLISSATRGGRLGIGTATCCRARPHRRNGIVSDRRWPAGLVEIVNCRRMAPTVSPTRAKICWPPPALPTSHHHVSAQHPARFPWSPASSAELHQNFLSGTVGGVRLVPVPDA
jgi:hypothetical protein